jgi:hypothetical protein
MTSGQREDLGEDLGEVLPARPVVKRQTASPRPTNMYRPRRAARQALGSGKERETSVRNPARRHQPPEEFG